MFSATKRTYVNRVGLCAVLIGLSAASAMRANGPQPLVLFIQQDKVTSFSFVTGQGAESGTATGAINGVSLTNFYFTVTPTSFPKFTFNDHVGITDIDGDQIIFDNIGTGTFIVPGLFDPTPLTPTQVLQTTGPFPQGGPLTGTYKVTATWENTSKCSPLVWCYRTGPSP